ncbi:MAG TPA: hypothetical protein PLS95_15050 [Thermoanaerobaculales bacterium]|nr:hypothetical protein [Thermoanaerobaculales bacterium]
MSDSVVTCPVCHVNAIPTPETDVCCDACLRAGRVVSGGVHRIDQHWSEDAPSPALPADGDGANPGLTCTVLLTKANEVRDWMVAAIDNVALMERKNRDYGSSFRAATKAETLYGLLVRIGDKVNRARKLAKAGLICEISEDDARPACTDETLIDTLRDLANYALIAQVEAGRSE